MFLKIEWVMNYQKICNWTWFSHGIFLWVLNCMHNNILSHWDLTFTNNFFPRFHPWYTNAIFATMNVLNIYHNDHNCTCCKSFSVCSMLTIIQFQMILFSLLATFHFTKFPLVLTSNTHTNIYTKFNWLNANFIRTQPQKTCNPSCEWV